MKADKREGPIRKLIACSAGVLLVRANAKSGRWGYGAGEKRRCNLHSPTPPLSLFLTVDRPLGINFYSPQPSAAIKIKDGSHNIRYQITWHSLAKITPAPQARKLSACMRKFLS